MAVRKGAAKMREAGVNPVGDAEASADKPGAGFESMCSPGGTSEANPRAGLHGPCALLMIDMQMGFIDPASPLCIAGAAATIDACADVLAAARAAGMRVFHVRREYAADGSDVEPVRHGLWLSGGRPLCREGDFPNSLDAPASLQAMPGEAVVVKPRFSAFFDTGLHETLQEAGVETLVLIGTTTPNCIRTTCYDALSYNYNVIVVEDATSSRTPQVQQANIADMAFIGATVVDSRTFAGLAAS